MKNIPFLFILMVCACQTGEEHDTLSYFSRQAGCAGFPPAYYGRLWAIVPDSLDYKGVDSLKPYVDEILPQKKPLSYCLEEEQKIQISRLYIHNFAARAYPYAKSCPFSVIHSGRDSSLFYIQSGEAFVYPDSIDSFIHFSQKHLPGVGLVEAVRFFYFLDPYCTQRVGKDSRLELLGFSQDLVAQKIKGNFRGWKLNVFVSENLYTRTIIIEYEKDAKVIELNLKRHAFFLLHNPQTGEYLSSSKPIPLDRKAYPNVLDTLDRYF